MFTESITVERYEVDGFISYLSLRSEEGVFTPSLRNLSSSPLSMGKVIFQFNRVDFCEDIHTKRRRANIRCLERGTQ